MVRVGGPTEDEEIAQLGRDLWERWVETGGFTLEAVHTAVTFVTWSDVCQEFRGEVLFHDELTCKIYAAALDAGVKFEPEPVMHRVRPWLDRRLLLVDLAHVNRIERWMEDLNGPRDRDAEFIHAALERARQELDRCGQPSWEDLRDFAACLLASAEMSSIRRIREDHSRNLVQLAHFVRLGGSGASLALLAAPTLPNCFLAILLMATWWAVASGIARLGRLVALKAITFKPSAQQADGIRSTIGAEEIRPDFRGRVRRGRRSSVLVGMRTSSNR